MLYGAAATAAATSHSPSFASANAPLTFSGQGWCMPSGEVADSTRLLYAAGSLIGTTALYAVNPLDGCYMITPDGKFTYKRDVYGLQGANALGLSNAVIDTAGGTMLVASGDGSALFSSPDCAYYAPVSPSSPLPWAPRVGGMLYAVSDGFNSYVFYGGGHNASNSNGCADDVWWSANHGKKWAQLSIGKVFRPSPAVGCNFAIASGDGSISVTDSTTVYTLVTTGVSSRPWQVYSVKQLTGHLPVPPNIVYTGYSASAFTYIAALGSSSGSGNNTYSASLDGVHWTRYSSAPLARRYGGDFTWLPGFNTVFISGGYSGLGQSSQMVDIWVATFRAQGALPLHNHTVGLAPPSNEGSTTAAHYGAAMSAPAVCPFSTSASPSPSAAPSPAATPCPGGHYGPHCKACPGLHGTVPCNGRGT